MRDLSEPDCSVSETQQRFERWGQKAIVLAKFVPGLAVIAPPLGTAPCVWGWRFLALSSIGATLSVGSFLAIGALLRKQIDGLLPLVERYGTIALLIVVVLLLLYIASSGGRGEGL